MVCPQVPSFEVPLSASEEPVSPDAIHSSFYSQQTVCVTDPTEQTHVVLENSCMYLIPKPKHLKERLVLPVNDSVIL